MKNILVKINTEEDFINIQEKVFKDGGVWFSGEDDIFGFDDIEDNIYALDIDLDGQGFVKDLNITYLEDEESFNTCKKEEDTIILSVEEVLAIDNLKEYLS